MVGRIEMRTALEQLQADTDDMVLDHWIVAASMFYARKAGKPVGMETFMRTGTSYAVEILNEMLETLETDRTFYKGTLICPLRGGRLGLVKLGQNPIGPMDFGVLRLTD